MKYKTYDKTDPRWSRVEIHPLCIDVPNVFTQILYTYKDSISDLDQVNSAIETGTYEGDTAEIFSEHFDKVYTVEKYVTSGNNYSQQNLLEIYKRLQTLHPNISFFSGDSAPFMQRVLTENPDTRFVILLDAHTHSHSPVVQELNSIHDYSNVNNHVIIIDDAIDVGTVGWPTTKEFEEAIRDINPEYNILPTKLGRKTTLIYT